MRKSHYITILLGGAAALAIWNLAGTKTTPVQDETKLYGDANACAMERDATECQQAFDAAKAEHVAQAPKFATAAECEAAGFTKCESAEMKTANGGSTSFFMPMMMGYMMGRMLGGGGMMGGYGMPPRAGAPMGTPSGAPASRPVYADRNGFLYAGGNTVGRVAPGTTSLGPQGVPLRTASRGGFGTTASRYGGAGA